jgi:2-oxoisovalerate dehydrogenase E2 component (dihydrolipoyl transacylase)
MSRYEFKLPDLGEGAVDAEIVAWKVAAGQQIQEDQPLVEMLTQKATVEVPAPVTGRVLSTTGTPGDRVAVGAVLAVFETGAESAAQPGRVPAHAAAGSPAQTPASAPPPTAAARASAAAAPQRVATSPAIRRRAREAGVDLATIAGSGPHGRIVLGDLAARLQADAAGDSRAPDAAPEVLEIPVTGLRRLIAEQVSHSAHTIPHFSYVEEVDVTALESLREQLNASGAALSYLPFIVLGLVRALARHPQCNARFDATRQMLLQYRAVHVGIAVQTPLGLKVPVIRDAQTRSLQAIDAEIRRLSAAARDGSARAGELTGSTITVTSLGKLGGIASTPIINQPELAIIGINRAVQRPVVHAGAITIRRMMNLSSSFDHRFIDGFDAARLIQTLRESLEQPALLFI